MGIFLFRLYVQGFSRLFRNLGWKLEIFEDLEMISWLGFLKIRIFLEAFSNKDF